MQIEIAQRLLPFSHSPGIKLLIPKTEVEVQIFPTRIYIAQEMELILDLQGPVVGFTVEMDLEKGLIHVFGCAKEGHFRYLIQAGERGIEFVLSKFGTKVLRLFCNQKISFLKTHESFLFPLKCKPFDLLNIFERLSLGMHKAQDWDLIKRRQDLKEIFPIWCRLSNLLPPSKENSNESKGNFALLKVCEELIIKKDKKEILPAFANFFNASFEGILTPRLHDTEFQGLSLIEDTSLEISPLVLLKKGAKLIRSLFFQEEEDSLFILPCLPPEFHAGRFINIKCENEVLVDIEWTKKLPRKVFIHPLTSTTKKVVFPKSIKSLRLRYSQTEKGKTLKFPVVLDLEKDRSVYLDHFEE